MVGDAGTRLPVDAYYPSLRLVLEYHERQHKTSPPFQGRKVAVSGTTGEQRWNYDQLRRDLFPKHGIKLVEISYSEFACRRDKRLQRNVAEDIEILRRRLSEWIRSQH
jgi:putative NADPH-quinone reductase